MAVQGIGTIATALGVFLALLSFRAARLQRRRQFELVFVQRYWSLMDDLSLDALAGRKNSEVTSSDEKAILIYIRLCEDELELRCAGWISTVTWSIWSKGMLVQLQRWPFNVVWQSISNSTADPKHCGYEYPLLSKHQTACQPSSPWDPWLEHSWRVRLWRAITPSP
jgi:hypothetical protein